MKKDPVIYIRHIHDYILRIEAYVQEGRAVFSTTTRPRMPSYAILKSSDRRSSAEQPAIPWTQIAGARNVLAHQYLGVDLNLVWNIVEKNLPALKAAIHETAAHLAIRLPGHNGQQ